MNLIPQVSELLVQKIEFYMNHRTGGSSRTAAVVCSSVYGLLGKTRLADTLINEIREASQ